AGRVPGSDARALERTAGPAASGDRRSDGGRARRRGRDQPADRSLDSTSTLPVGGPRGAAEGSARSSTKRSPRTASTENVGAPFRRCQATPLERRTVPVPSDVTIPGPNSSAARRVFGAYLKRTASDLLRWPLTRFDARVAADFAAVRRVLVDQVREKTPGALFGVLRRPTVSTLVRCIDAELWGEGNPMKLDAWL